MGILAQASGGLGWGWVRVLSGLAYCLVLFGRGWGSQVCRCVHLAGGSPPVTFLGKLLPEQCSPVPSWGQFRSRFCGEPRALSLSVATSEMGTGSPVLKEACEVAALGKRSCGDD